MRLESISTSHINSLKSPEVPLEESLAISDQQLSMNPSGCSKSDLDKRPKMGMINRQLARVPLRTGNNFAWVLLAGAGGFIIGWIVCFEWLTNNFIVLPPT